MKTFHDRALIEIKILNFTDSEIILGIELPVWTSYNGLVFLLSGFNTSATQILPHIVIMILAAFREAVFFTFELTTYCNS